MLNQCPLLGWTILQSMAARKWRSSRRKVSLSISLRTACPPLKACRRANSSNQPRRWHWRAGYGARSPSYLLGPFDDAVGIQTRSLRRKVLCATPAISGALPLRSQPACVMVAYNGDSFRTGVHASRYFHVLRPGQFESGTQHVCLCPFNQTPPHGTCEDERGVEKMTNLQELPDHHGFEHGSEPARGRRCKRRT